MREIRLSGSEEGGRTQSVLPTPIKAAALLMPHTQLKSAPAFLLLREIATGGAVRGDAAPLVRQCVMCGDLPPQNADVFFAC